MLSRMHICSGLRSWLSLHWLSALLLWAAAPVAAHGGSPEPRVGLGCFARAYPEAVCAVEENSLVLCDGQRFTYDDGRDKSYAERLEQPDLQDMLAQRYPALAELRAPAPHFEPGRVRLTAFFQALYGKTPRDVSAQLTRVAWLPEAGGKSVQIAKKHGAAARLQAVERALAELPEPLRREAAQLAGSVSYRNIAGTERTSAHAFGIALDVAPALGDYFRWREPHNEPPQRYRNRMPREIVQAFEREGFIWGGRWNHYDTLHFEYRPELLQPGCVAPQTHLARATPNDDPPPDLAAPRSSNLPRTEAAADGGERDATFQTGAPALAERGPRAAEAPQEDDVSFRGAAANSSHHLANLPPTGPATRDGADLPRTGPATRGSEPDVKFRTAAPAIAVAERGPRSAEAPQADRVGDYDVLGDRQALGEGVEKSALRTAGRAALLGPGEQGARERDARSSAAHGGADPKARATDRAPRVSEQTTRPGGDGTEALIDVGAPGYSSGQDPYAFPHATTAQTLEARLAPPPGFRRLALAAGSFGAWLRRLPLQAGRGEVALFDGRPKSTQALHAAVLDIDVGRRDLQQCADAVMRLRAEYLWSTRRADAVCFRAASGQAMPYSAFRRGERPPPGRAAPWTPQAAADSSWTGFRSYLDRVFNLANTASLTRELTPLRDPRQIEPGDVYIEPARGARYGHAVLVLDVTEDARGERSFLISQSYMPAQSIHVLKNPQDPQASPWYRAPADGSLETPEWSFPAGSLRRFAGSCSE